MWNIQYSMYILIALINYKHITTLKRWILHIYSKHVQSTQNTHTQHTHTKPSRAEGSGTGMCSIPFQPALNIPESMGPAHQPGVSGLGPVLMTWQAWPSAARSTAHSSRGPLLSGLGKPCSNTTKHTQALLLLKSRFKSILKFKVIKKILHDCLSQGGRKYDLLSTSINTYLFLAHNSYKYLP